MLKNQSFRSWAPRAFPLAGLLAVVGTASAGAVSNGIIGHWTFDEMRGGIAYDSSGYGSDGTIIGATWTTGIAGGALSFDGAGNYVNCGNAAILNPANAITVSAWWKPTVSFGGSGNDPIVDKGYYFHGAPYYQYHLGVTGDLYGVSQASVGFSVAPVGGPTTPAHTWSVGNWYLVTGTYDGVSVRVYVNGNLMVQAAGSGAMVDYGMPVLIGKFANLPYSLAGIIDDVQMYDRALTCTEVQFLFDHPGAEVIGVDNPADLDGDGNVGGADLGILLGHWGACPAGACAGDLDCSGGVDGSDLGVLLGSWGG